MGALFFKYLIFLNGLIAARSLCLPWANLCTFWSLPFFGCVFNHLWLHTLHFVNLFTFLFISQMTDWWTIMACYKHKYNVVFLSIQNFPDTCDGRYVFGISRIGPDCFFLLVFFIFKRLSPKTQLHNMLSKRLLSFCTANELTRSEKQTLSAVLCNYPFSTSLRCNI